MIRGALGHAVDFALPPRCPGCGAIVAGTHRFCLACWQALDFLGGPACARCAEPLDRPGEPACARCAAASPGYDGVAAAVAYGSTARHIALRLKYGGRPRLATTVARQMIRLVPADRTALIVPVPLHRWRLWRRGYNQAALIGDALARLSGLPHHPGALVRTSATPVLRGLGPVERRRAVRGVFAVPRPALVAGRAILLIDDVYTTGATADACARALKHAGAAEVRLLCWARVVRQAGVVADR